MKSPLSTLRDRGFDAGRWADASLAVVNRLCEPRAVEATLPPAGKLLAILLALAFLPRLFMALHLSTICVDGAGYIASAESIVRGDAVMPIVYRLNLYPIILAGLHQLGLGWETAAESWGVLCSTLVVLPLFGWVRRQFNDVLAVTVCLLYAAHPELIEWSPEALRDQTFWLLTVSTLYFSYRAVTELQWRHFIGVGITLPLCIFTRFEGVFLLLALGGWSVVRLWHLRDGRRRLVLGLTLASIFAPLLLVTANACLYRQKSLSELLYLEPVKRIGAFFHRLEDGNLDNFDATPKLESRTDVSPFAPAIFWQVGNLIERAFAPQYAVMFLFGAFAFGRRFFRSDLLPLSLIAGVTIAGTWIHRWETGSASSRYILTIVILALPCASVGLLRIGGLLDAAFRRTTWPRLAMPMLLVTLTTVGWLDALTTRYGSREMRADLGRWIQHQYGGQCHLVGTDEQLPIVAFYAGARVTPLTPKLDMESILATLADQRPDVVLFSQPPITSNAQRFIKTAGDRLGLTQMPPPHDDVSHTGLIVLGRGKLAASARSHERR